MADTTHLRTMVASLLTLTLALASGCASTSASAPPASAALDLSGRWASDCTPMSETQAFTLGFELTAKAWTLDYDVYADKTCSARFLTVRVEGDYEVGAESPSVPGAEEAVFHFRRKAITPHGAAAAQYLASDAGCNLPGFSDGVASDVTVTGCPALGQYPVPSCGADYDVVRLQGDTLTFGARPADNDMCSPDKRPRALSTVISRRK